MGNETEFRPKPMVMIGNRPILWHIMKSYSDAGFNEFILCLGYKGEMIRDYFRDYEKNTRDFTLTMTKQSKMGLPSPNIVELHGESDIGNWRITFADTGQSTMTAKRIHLIQKYLGDDEEFLLTYGDGVGNIDIRSSIDFHRGHGKICTLTAVHPPGRFGELDIDSCFHEGGFVKTFNEKPQSSGGYINGGFMVCSKGIFQYLEPENNVMLENGPMKNLAAHGQLAAYKHEGFWQPMDTQIEHNFLNKLWDDGKAPWKS
jgi:glucose-1-phosphate cytidylyltransferase